jgi:hypothetical protein
MSARMTEQEIDETFIEAATRLREIAPEAADELIEALVAFERAVAEICSDCHDDDIACEHRDAPRCLACALEVGCLECRADLRDQMDGEPEMGWRG